MDNNVTGNLIENINNFLLETENYANEFLSIKDTLEPIREDVNFALDELKGYSKSADNISDKVFYLNRYTDLVKKIESIFDMRSKRLQQTLSIISKLDLADKIALNSNNNNNDEEDNKKLTPEQANELIKVLNKIEENN